MQKGLSSSGSQLLFMHSVDTQRGSRGDQQIAFLADEHSKNTAIPPHEESKASEVLKVRQTLERENERL